VTPAQLKHLAPALVAAALLTPIPAIAAKHTQGTAFSVSKNIHLGNKAFPAAPPPDDDLEVVSPTIEIEGASVLTFDGFDPALGTLRNVRLYLDSRQSVDGGGSIIGTAGPDAGIIEVDPGVDTRFLVGGEEYGAEHTMIYPAGDVVPRCAMIVTDPGCLFHRSSQEDFDVDLLVGPLAAFFAPTVTVALPYRFAMSAKFTSYNRPTFTAVADFDWSGNAFLTYDYLPAAPGGVPEPSAWLLLIAGFGIAGSAMRRRGQTASGPDATRFTALR
jgi:hypothetical protein